MKASRYTVIIFPDNEEKNHQFVVRRRTIKSGITLAVIFLLALIGSSFYFIPKALDYDDLYSRYESLAADRMEVYDLLQDLQRMKQLDQLIRKTLGPEMALDAAGKNPSTTLDTSASETLPISYGENIPSQLPLQGYITQRMSRTSVYRRQNHYGIDIAAREGEPVLASASGFVVFAGWTYDLGNLLILYHGDGYFTYYGHNQRNLVQTNQVVRRGDVIGLVGSTGISSGPHLHFEIWRSGEPVDPMDYFPQYYDSDLSPENHG